MILFSTVLPINETMTPDDFIRLVLEWNENHKYQENRVTGVSWHGEHSIRFGDEKLWMQIEEYRSRNIIAVRYERTDEDGTVWDTDYVVNFDEKKISVRLDRSYTEDALLVRSNFSTPHFISLLVDKGYLAADGRLPIDKLPVLLDESNLELLDGVTDWTAGCRLAVVYVSNTRSGEVPVDAGMLASRLKGAAHVLVQADEKLEEAIAGKLGGQEVKDGSVLVIYPNEAVGQKIFRYRAYKGNDKMFADRITKAVIEYSNIQMVDQMYTWQGVENALLLESFNRKREELLSTEENLRESEKKIQETEEKAKESEQKALESEKLAQKKELELDFVYEESEKLEKRVADLTRLNESLTYENQGIRAKYSHTSGQVPVLYLGEEEEFFRDEIKAILVEALQDALKNCHEGSRRYDVIKDILENNLCKCTAAEKGEQIKNLFTGYSNVNNEMKQELADIGIEFKRGDNHYVLSYYGDDRYDVVIPKTSSDKGRGGKNTALEIIRNML